MSQSSYIALGEISGVLGVKGWVKVFSHTDPRVKITEYDQWFLRKKDQDWYSVKVLNGRKQGKNIVAQLEGINSREQAEALKGVQIAIQEGQLEVLPENEYYWKDLIGINVETTQGIDLGKIDWIFNTGSNDVLTIKEVSSKDNKERVERLLPFLMDDVVISINIKDNLMIVDWDPEF
ncbi:MAG TPA: ribosome maturation factor RimM [Leucothrix sp.]|nr:ribosome maturation factor RimM [Leucothrix sp.]